MLQELSESAVQGVLAKIDAAAAKLGVAADHFWPLLVQREARSAAVTLGSELVGIAVLGTAAALLFVEAGKKRGLDGYLGFAHDEANRITMRVMACICIGISMIVLGYATDTWTALLNPEATALLRLLGK